MDSTTEQSLRYDFFENVPCDKNQRNWYANARIKLMFCL